MLDVISSILYGPIDMYMHAWDNVDRGFIILIGSLFYLSIGFAAFLMIWGCYYVLGTFGVNIQEQSGKVESLTLESENTTLMPIQSGNVLLMVPQFNPASWTVDMRVQDMIWPTSVSKSAGDTLVVGQDVLISYRKGRISGQAHIINLV